MQEVIEFMRADEVKTLVVFGELCTTPISVKFLSCVQLCDPMDGIMPGLPVYHQLLELAETHVH